MHLASLSYALSLTHTGMCAHMLLTMHSLPGFMGAPHLQ